MLRSQPPTFRDQRRDSLAWEDALAEFGVDEKEVLTLTRLLQLVAICFRTIKSWSGFADDLWWRSSKCSANNDILKFFLLLKY